MHFIYVYIKSEENPFLEKKSLMSMRNLLEGLYNFIRRLRFNRSYDCDRKIRIFHRLWFGVYLYPQLLLEIGSASSLGALSFLKMKRRCKHLVRAYFSTDGNIPSSDPLGLAALHVFVFHES